MLCAASTYCWAAPIAIRLAATKEERMSAKGIAGTLNGTGLNVLVSWTMGEAC